MIKPLKQKKQFQQKQSLNVDSRENKNEMDINKFFQLVMSNVEMLVLDKTLTIKRELKDLMIENKMLKTRVIELETDFKSLGIALGQLGIAEINILNRAKNSIREKISVTDNNGNVLGKKIIRRFNLSIEKPEEKIINEMELKVAGEST